MSRTSILSLAALLAALAPFGCETGSSSPAPSGAAEMRMPPLSDDAQLPMDAAFPPNDIGVSGPTDASSDGSIDTGAPSTLDATQPITMDMGLPVRPNFWQDVAPLLDARCMGCHQEGGASPFTLDTYAQARSWGPAMVAATQARAMPPWLVKGDDTCGEWRHNEWLRNDELAVLADWVAAEMPEGPPGTRTLPTIDHLAHTHAVSTPDFTPRRADMEGAEFDEYRCFMVEVDDLPAAQFLTGYEVFPGNDAIVHHVIGNIVNPQAPSRRGARTNGELMAALDAESPDRPGWPCYSQAGNGVRIEANPVAWAPGQGPVRFPEGTGVPMAPGNVLVLQVHYNLFDAANIGSSDTTQVTLAFEAEVEHELSPLYIDYFLGGDERQSVPAGEAAYDYQRRATFADLGIEDQMQVWGVLPHMHERGQRLNATLQRAGGETECMTQVDAWDFAWQRLYWYREPMLITPQDTWEITCTFDTRTAEMPVTAGWGTRNEMCLTVLYVSR